MKEMFRTPSKPSRTSQTDVHDRKRGVLHFRPLHEATFMHRRPEELHHKKDRDAEFREEMQLVDDLRKNK